MGLVANIVVLAALWSSAAPAAAPRHESEAQRLYRKGVHCMEVLERRDCAIERFEELLDATTNERELVTDAMLRLIRLYEKEKRQADIPDLLRRFWDVGRKRRTQGHVPYTARYFPEELNIVVNIDTPRIVGSPVMEALGVDARDLVFTCDEARRNDIRNRRRWQRAATKAKAQGKPTWQVAYAEIDAERKREARRRTRERPDDAPPIFLEAACPVALALGQDDLLGWRRMTGAMNHQDARRSLAVAEVPGLAPLLRDAEAQGRLVSIGEAQWRLVDFEYAGGAVHLAMLDRDELLVAPAGMMDGVVTARNKRRKQMNREVAALIDEVPSNTGFFMVMNQAAMRELGFRSMKKSSRSVLEALLPRPKGLQIAAVFGDHAGLFTRVPTDNPVKARMLVSLANTMLIRSAEDDPEAAMWLSGLDIAESHDRKAMLASYVASSRQLQKLFKGY